jgi:hypothetical protein
MSAPDRPTFTVTFRPEPGVDASRALRHLLKFVRRRFGLRCVAVDEKLGLLMAEADEASKEPCGRWRDWPGA